MRVKEEPQFTGNGRLGPPGPDAPNRAITERKTEPELAIIHFRPTGVKIVPEEIRKSGSVGSIFAKWTGAGANGPNGAIVRFTVTEMISKGDTERAQIRGRIRVENIAKGNPSKNNFAA